MPQTVSTTRRRRRIPIPPRIQSSVEEINADGTLYVIGDNNTEHSWRLKALGSPRRLVIEHRGVSEWEERAIYSDILSSKTNHDRVITDLLGDAVSNSIGNVLEALL